MQTQSQTKTLHDQSIMGQLTTGPAVQLHQLPWRSTRGPAPHPPDRNRWRPTTPSASTSASPSSRGRNAGDHLAERSAPPATSSASTAARGQTRRQHGRVCHCALLKQRATAVPARSSRGADRAPQEPRQTQNACARAQLLAAPSYQMTASAANQHPLAAANRRTQIGGRLQETAAINSREPRPSSVFRPKPPTWDTSPQEGRHRCVSATPDSGIADATYQRPSSKTPIEIRNVIQHLLYQH